MTIRCPHCNKEYDIDTATLDKAQGMIICGQCQQVFDASKSRELAPPEEDIWGFDLEDLPTHAPPPPDEPLLLEELDEAASASPSQHANHDIPEDMQRLRAEEVPPEFMQHYLPSASRKPPKWMILATLLLFATGLAQIAWIYRDQLMAQPLTAAWLESACALLGCSDQLQSPVRPIQISAHKLRSNSFPEGSYELTAVLHNPDVSEQPLPALELQLLNDAQQVIARRTFTPASYGFDNASPNTLPPGKDYRIKLILVHRGEPHRGYQLKLIPGRT